MRRLFRFKRTSGKLYHGWFVILFPGTAAAFGIAALYAEDGEWLVDGRRAGLLGRSDRFLSVYLHPWVLKLKRMIPTS